MTKKLKPITPGEILKKEFLDGFGLSQNQLASAIRFSPNRITGIVRNGRPIIAEVALRLGLFFGNSPEFWMNLQTRYDLESARRALKTKDAERIAKLGPLSPATGGKERRLGILASPARLPMNFDAPLPAEVLDAFEGRGPAAVRRSPWNMKSGKRKQKTSG